MRFMNDEELMKKFVGQLAQYVLTFRVMLSLVTPWASTPTIVGALIALDGMRNPKQLQKEMPDILWAVCLSLEAASGISGDDVTDALQRAVTSRAAPDATEVN